MKTILTVESIEPNIKLMKPLLKDGYSLSFTSQGSQGGRIQGDHQEIVITAKIQSRRPDYLFFYSHRPSAQGRIGKECLSQWYDSPFTVDGVAYPTAEHFMMAEKARLFGDEETLKEILLAPGPDVAQKLGQQVRSFDDGTWSQRRFEIVVRGNEAKFGQNERLKKFLVDTQDKILVEASPIDKIWGIGLAKDDSRTTDPELWRGLNLLGFALMVVRAGL